MKIRSCRLADSAAVAELATELGYPTGAAQAEARLAVLLASQADAVLVAEEDDGTVVGWLHARETRALESDPGAEIAGLVVAAPRRGRGHGRALVEGALRWAAARGLPTLRVRTNVARQETQRWYRAAGFAAVKTQVVFSRGTSPSETPAAPAAPSAPSAPGPCGSPPDR
jgi:ribosomal protein S18 acetylase RimI-like enzyme